MKTRKFWVACGLVLVAILAGLGYELVPGVKELITSPDSPLWTIIEGILEALERGG